MTFPALVDTNFLSELRKPNPSRRVLAFLARCSLEELFVSTVSFMEIRFGIQQEPDAIRRTELETWLAERVRPMFASRTLEITEDIMLRWRNLVEAGRKAGHTYSQPDLIIAATALEHGLALVTRNVRDFVGLEVNLLNPWEAL